MIAQANATGVGLQADAASVRMQANAIVVELTQASVSAGFGGRCRSGWNAYKCDRGSSGTPSFGNFFALVEEGLNFDLKEQTNKHENLS
mgnify:CR=1 FL=1